MQTGLMVVGPHGGHYWFECPTATAAEAVLDRYRAAGHRAVLDNPGTRIEFGKIEGGAFVPEIAVKTPTG